MSRGGIPAVYGCFTIPLARYEYGNIVWKHHVARKKIDEETALELLSIGYGLLDRLKMVDTSGSELEVYRIAKETRLSFYDSSYIYAAESNRLRIITEDKELSAAAVARGIPSSSLSERLAPGKGFEPLRP